jgi:hypothetical protein
MCKALLPLLLAVCAFGATKPEEIVPKPKAPFVQPAEADRVELHKSIQAYMALPAEQVTAHPAAKDFPGAVDSKERVTRAVAYDGNLVHRWDTAASNAPNLATSPDAWQETGLYAAPGEIVTVTAPSLPEGRTVRIVVGCHRDGLLKLEKWQRFPLITRTFDLQPGENKIANAFGGQLFIQVRNGAAAKGNGKAAKAAPTKAANGPATLTFANAVAMPTYVLGKDTPETWKQSLASSPAPWVTFVAKHAILHVRRATVAKIVDPKPITEWWDKAMDLEDDLIALRRLAPERVVPDVQISAGFMHSGYPFMCFINPSEAEIVDLAKLSTKGNWGFFHELGHNHQRTDWTFPGQTEVTCNLFSLYCMEKLVGLPRGSGHGSVKDLDANMAKRLATPPNLGAFEQLAPFIALIQAHGWDPLRTTLRSYAETPAKGDLAAKQNAFVLRYGQAAKADVSDFFTKLGYPVTAETKQALKAYPAYAYVPAAASGK